MLKINTEHDPNQGQWRTYPRRTGVECLIRPCTRKVYRAVGQEVGEGADAEQYTQAELRQVVMEWRGIVDQNDAPLPCTPEMIDRVSELEVGFAAWAFGESRAMLLAMISSTEAELGNSDASAEALPPAPAEA